MSRLELDTWAESLPPNLSINGHTNRNSLPHVIMLQLAREWITIFIHRPCYRMSSSSDDKSGSETASEAVRVSLCIAGSSFIEGIPGPKLTSNSAATDRRVVSYLFFGSINNASHYAYAHPPCSTLLLRQERLVFCLLFITRLPQSRQLRSAKLVSALLTCASSGGAGKRQSRKQIFLKIS